MTILNENKNRLNLLKEFLDYERNKLIFENFISQEESLSIRVTNQMDKINHYFKIRKNKREYQDWISFSQIWFKIEWNTRSN